MLTRRVGFPPPADENGLAPPGAVNPRRRRQPNMSRIIPFAVAAALIVTSLLGADFPTYWP
jgi:hypothetical protein